MSVITISRQFGAGGITLGQAVAKELGYTFVDNEIIQNVAHEAKVSTDWVKSIEKEAGGKLLKFISSLVSKNLVDRILDDQRGYIDEEIYVDLLHQIIRQLAAEGNVIILGRGSQYILSEQKDVYHVLLVAKKADRVKFMEEHYELTPTPALNAVNNEDKRRLNLYKKFGKQDYDNPDLYHLVLNMSRVHMDTAIKLVCCLVRPQ